MATGRSTNSPSRPGGGLPRLGRRQFVLLVGAPCLVFVAMGYAIWKITGAYSDIDREWEALAAVWTGLGVAVAAVGLPVAIWQLLIVQQEQERLAAQLAARPEQDVGFAALDDPSRGVEDEKSIVVPRLGENESAVIEIAIAAVSVGGRTVRTPEWSIDFPPWAVPQPSHGGGETFLERRVNAGALALNPQQQRIFSFLLTIDASTPPTGDFVCSWSSEDVARQTKTLHLTINRER